MEHKKSCRAAYNLAAAINGHFGYPPVAGNLCRLLKQASRGSSIDLLRTAADFVLCDTPAISVHGAENELSFGIPFLGELLDHRKFISVRRRHQSQHQKNN